MACMNFYGDGNSDFRLWVLFVGQVYRKHTKLAILAPEAFSPKKSATYPKNENSLKFVDLQ